MTATQTTPRSRIERASHLRWVPIADIHINPLAQREYRPPWAAQIAAEFDPEAFKPPVVSHRGSKYYCIDGQHTIGAFRLMSWGDQEVQCWVYEGLTEEQEADLFLKLNNTKNIPAFEEFTVAVNAGRETETDIDRIVRANGMKISKKEDGISCVTALEKVYEAGPKVLGRTVRITRDAFGDRGFEASVIKGIGQVCARYNGEIDDAALVAKLGRIRGGVNGLLSNARHIEKQMSKPMYQCVAAAVVETYNSGRGGKKLPGWWKQ